MKKMIGVLLAVLLAACSGNEVGFGENQPVGAITIPLTTSVGTTVYRLSGTIDIHWTGALPRQVAQVALVGDMAFIEHVLPVGGYRLALRPGWQLSRDGVDVTGSALLAQDSQLVTISANASTHVTWAFTVAGRPVILDPCVPSTSAPQCTTGDADADGIANGIECPSGAATGQCVDSDGDAVPDFQDADSDGDSTMDAVDPGRLDACNPDPFAPSCTNPTSGTARVTVQVSETCDAAQCTFGADAGAASDLPPSPFLSAFGGPPPLLLQEGTTATFLLVSPGGLQPGEFFTANLSSAPGLSLAEAYLPPVTQTQVVLSMGAPQGQVAFSGVLDGIADGNQTVSVTVRSSHTAVGGQITNYQDFAVPVTVLDIN